MTSTSFQAAENGAFGALVPAELPVHMKHSERLSKKLVSSREMGVVNYTYTVEMVEFAKGVRSVVIIIRRKGDSCLTQHLKSRFL
jgi:hypothetical protein